MTLYQLDHQGVNRTLRQTRVVDTNTNFCLNDIVSTQQRVKRISRRKPGRFLQIRRPLGKRRTIFMATTQMKNIIRLLIDGGKLWKGSLLACIIKDEVKRVGFPREGGIKCLCHERVFSMSNFELHAGSKYKMGSSYIFLLDGSGKSLAILKEELEASQQTSRGQSSTVSTLSSIREHERNTCNFCSREGELTICNTPSCPAAYHPECSPFQIPPGWHCQKCSCRLCEGPLRTSDSALQSHLVFCEQCGDEYHMRCLLDRGNFCYSLDFKWFCSKNCEKSFETLGDIIKLSLPPGDPHPVTLVRWSGDQDDIIFFDDDASRLHTLESRKAGEATRLFATLKLLEKNFTEVIHRRSLSDLFHNLLYPDPKDTSRSTERALDHIGFYTFLLEESAGDRVISRVLAVATIRIHGKKVAEMPFIATSESDRGKGFCTELMKGLQNILKRLEVQYLVVQSPPELLDMWSSKHSLHPVRNETKRYLLECNLMKLEGTTLLCKTIDY